MLCSNNIYYNSLKKILWLVDLVLQLVKAKISIVRF